MRGGPEKMNRIVASIIISVAAGLILAATAWNFSAVASMPNDYLNREEHLKRHDKLDNKLDRIWDKIEQIYKEMPR